MGGANGPPNVPEFGSVRTEAGFKNLYATSAVQHVVPGGKYPAVMVTTGANDPRVDPWQAAKMAATLQADSAGGHGLIGQLPAVEHGRSGVPTGAVAAALREIPGPEAVRSETTAARFRIPGRQSVAEEFFPCG